MTQLKEYSTRDAITIPADASIDDAIRLLQQHEIRHLPVVREGLPVGMVSAGNVLETVGGLLAEERVSMHDPTVPYAGPTVIEEIMTTGIVALSPEDSITAGAQLMLERQIAAVVLVSNEKIVGIVTERDYLRRFCDESEDVPDAWRRQPVANHMATEIVTAAPIENAFALFRNMGKRIHHLPVMENGKLVGILSDHDVRRAMALDKIEQITQPEQRIRLVENFNAGSIMSTNITTTTPTTTLAKAAIQMIENKVGALPVIEADELAGIITDTDILRAYVDLQDDSP